VLFDTGAVAQTRSERCGSGRDDKERDAYGAKNYFVLRRIRGQSGAVVSVYSQSSGHSFSRSLWEHWGWHQNGLGGGSSCGEHGGFPTLPAYVGPGKRAVSPEVALSGGIMVDSGGKRFVDETKYPGGLGNKMLELPGKQAYEIFDERIYQFHGNISGPRNLAGLYDSGLLKKAQNLEGLAGQLGIDAGGLQQTIQDYNLAARGGRDAFGRTLPERLNAPFYGIKVTVALYHTQGGLKVSPDGQVARPDGYSPKSVRGWWRGYGHLREGFGRLPARQWVTGFAGPRYDSRGARHGGFEGSEFYALTGP
jgi:hypothetical protein